MDLELYRMSSLVLDHRALLSALGISEVHGVVGHDFGSPVAAWCALIRPDVFRRVVMMSAPFGGAPGFGGRGRRDIEAELAAPPVPRDTISGTTQQRRRTRTCSSVARDSSGFWPATTT